MLHSFRVSLWNYSWQLTKIISLNSYLQGNGRHIVENRVYSKDSSKSCGLWHSISARSRTLWIGKAVVEAAYLLLLSGKNLTIINKNKALINTCKQHRIMYNYKQKRLLKEIIITYFTSIVFVKRAPSSNCEKADTWASLLFPTISFLKSRHFLKLVTAASKFFVRQWQMPSIISDRPSIGSWVLSSVIEVQSERQKKNAFRHEKTVQSWYLWEILSSCCKQISPHNSHQFYWVREDRPFVYFYLLFDLTEVEFRWRDKVIDRSGK